MTDLAPLQPIDSSPTAIAAAITRCGVAGRGALAEIDRLKSERTGLLLAGHPAQLAANLTALTGAMGDATQIGELLDRLQKMLQAATPAPSAEEQARAKAIQASAELAVWWTQHGQTLLGGLQVLATTMATFADWTTAAASTGPAVASNVTQLQPRPNGAA